MSSRLAIRFDSAAPKRAGLKIETSESISEKEDILDKKTKISALMPDLEAWEEARKLKILLYLPHEDAIGERLLSTIEGLAINEKIEIYRRIDSLTQRLREPTYDIDISILMIPNKKELSGILLIFELMRDIKTILILPDSEQNTLSRGHKLYPRYISFIDGDFKDIAAVLKKMIKNKQRQERKDK